MITAEPPAAIDRSAPPAKRSRHLATLGRDPLRGTCILLRLALRRERIPLAAWVLAVVITVLSSLLAIAELYPGEASRQALADVIAANPAFLVIAGPLNASSVGGVTAWRVAMIGAVLVSLMAIFTVVRCTRADEETGRTELLASGVVGRAAGLTAALLLVLGGCGSVAVLVGVAATALGQAAGPSFLLGCALAGPGLLFGGLTAVAVQLFENSRAATAVGGAALGLAFALRAAGDVTGVPALTWMSPVGWTGQVSAFGQNRWWVLLLFSGGAVVAVVVAFRLLAGRDLGLARFGPRPGPATNPALDSAFALAARLHRGSLIGWAVGFLVLGALSGGIADSAGDLLDGNPQLLALMSRLGGSTVLVDALLAAMGGIAGLLAAAYGISAALRPAGEENADRASAVLATAISRPRWLAGHLAFALAGPAGLLALGGVVAGLLHGLRSGHLGQGFLDGMLSMVAQLPAALVMTGIAVLLFGVAPGLTGLAWAALAAALLLGQLGPLLQLPQWLSDLSPFTHIGPVPAHPVAWPATMILLLVAAGLIAAGTGAFRRRDLTSR